MKNAITKLVKENDKLLQEINRKKNKKCECCGKECQVAHHWIEKSRSARLRYDWENIIPLCNACHFKIHNIFGNNVVGGVDIAEVIIKKRGKAWKTRMDNIGHETIKNDIIYQQKINNRLKEELEILTHNR